jgi:hypothetical protein
MREIYANVLERLLVIHYEAEKKEPSHALINNEDSVNRWPPRPWPPWDDDDGEDDDDDGRKDRPKNSTKLAEEVVKFEWKLARASLDLLGHFEKSIIQILTVAQRHLIPGSSIHLQQSPYIQHHRDHNPSQFPQLFCNIYATQLPF